MPSHNGQNGKGNKRKRTGRPNGNYSAETRAAAAVDGFELGVPRAVAKWSARLNLEDGLPEATLRNWIDKHNTHIHITFF